MGGSERVLPARRRQGLRARLTPAVGLLTPALGLAGRGVSTRTGHGFMLSITDDHLF
jgi:hypothetical protein